jgi:tape measure domain-containing protein
MAAKDIEAGRAHVLIAIRDRLSQGLKTAEAKLRAFGSSVALSAGVMTGGIGAAIAWPIKLAANMEQTKTGFATMLKSEEAAAQLMEKLSNFSANTPFEFPEIASTAKSLLAYGSSVGDLTSELTILGDISSGLGEPIGELAELYGKARIQGKLMSEDLNQFTGRGVNILPSLAAQFGVTTEAVKELASEGKISFGNLQVALNSLATGNGQFAGGMAKQSQTLMGLFSTLKDNVGAVARAFGDAMLPTLKAVADVGIKVSNWIVGFIKNNQAMVAVIAKVLLVGFSVAGAIAAVGAAIVGASFVVGMMASAFATLASVMGVVFSPLGVVIGLLMAAAGVAYYFRGAIAQALAPVVAFFQPVIDTVRQLYGIFMQTFGGIVAALQSGSLDQAASIAWAGFSAFAWAAIADVMGAFTSLLGFLETFLPGISEMFSSAFAGIGQAILAGRWDLAGAILMNKLYLVMTQGWNAIAFAWDMAVTGFQTVFDTVFTGITSAFWTTVYGFAASITWLSGQISSLLNIEDPLQGALDGLLDMYNEQEAADKKAAMARDAARNEQNQQNADERAQSEKDIEAKIAGLERVANRKILGQPQSLDGKAEKARRDLEEALAKAKKEREGNYQNGYKAAEGPQALAGAASSSSGGKGGGTTGTFSAIASALGNMSSSAVENTAKNTAALVKLAKKQLEKQEPGMAP